MVSFDEKIFIIVLFLLVFVSIGLIYLFYLNTSLTKELANATNYSPINNAIVTRNSINESYYFKPLREEYILDVINNSIICIKKSFYSKDDLLEIMLYWDILKDKYLDTEIDKYSKYNITISHVNITVNPVNNSIIMVFIVENVIHVDGYYNADYTWFLKPLNLTLTDPGFNISNNTFIWKKVVNDTQVVVLIKIPAKIARSRWRIYTMEANTWGYNKYYIWWIEEKP